MFIAKSVFTDLERVVYVKIKPKTSISTVFKREISDRLYTDHVRALISKNFALKWNRELSPNCLKIKGLYEFWKLEPVFARRKEREVETGKSNFSAH